MLTIIENPFAGWRFYLVHAPTGKIVGFSNSLTWCERMVIHNS